VLMSRGRLRLLAGGDELEVWTVTPGAASHGLPGLTLEQRFRGELATAVQDAVADLVQCVHFGSAPLCTGQDGLVAITLAEQALALAG
jgi:hypothetical protein